MKASGFGSRTSDHIDEVFGIDNVIVEHFDSAAQLVGLKGFKPFFAFLLAQNFHMKNRDDHIKPNFKYLQDFSGILRRDCHFNQQSRLGAGDHAL